MASTSTINHRMIRSAYATLRNHTYRTPILHSRLIDSLVPTSHDDLEMEIYFKAENRQFTGSFKFRGAMNSLGHMSDAQLRKGVCMTSSGNFAKAVTVAAKTIAQLRSIDIPTTAVMPNNALEHKVKSVELAGGIVLRSGASWAERSSTLSELSHSTGATLLSGDQDSAVLQGQGTLALEFVEQLREERGFNLDCLIMPCGTGGLLSGCAAALHGTGVKVFGVEPEQGGADDGSRGRRLGRRIEHVQSSSIADGLRSPIGPLAWDIIRHRTLVEDIVSVTEEQITSVLDIAAALLGETIEPSAAVGLAATLFNPSLREAIKSMPTPRRIGIVLTGGNVESQSPRS